MNVETKSREDRLRTVLNNLSLIGITGSTTSTTEAPLILIEGKEKEVREEDIVVIENKNGGLILAVCRKGTGINENLKVGGYSPGIAYVRSTGKAPSTAKEAYHFILSFIGMVEDDSLRANDVIVAPGSPVYVFRGSKNNPLEFMRPDDCVFGGFLAREKNWPIPFDKRFIPYHIGVFGATGSGKSFLARYLLIPLLKRAGYGVLVLDWAGVDYAPYFEEVVSISDVKRDLDSVISYIIEKTRRFGYRQEPNILTEALEEVITESWSQLLDACDGPEELKDRLKELISRKIEGSELLDRYKRTAFIRLERGFQKISPDDLRELMGKKDVKELIVQPGRVLVVDMHGVGDEEKLSFFLTLAEHIISRMHKKEELNLALIIDEGPQYCPFEPRGLQSKVTDKIKDLCAMGRKHKLCVVLISQGIAGEIGINAAVRRNLNTQFIGQIHPLDIEEASKRLSPYGIKPEGLLYLEPGKFYFVGKMNPSPTPLLISFGIKGGE